MADAEPGKNRTDAIFLPLLAFLTAVAVARTAYIGFSPAPVPFAVLHWLLAAAILAFGWPFTTRRYHPAVGNLLKALGLVQLAFAGRSAPRR